MYKSWEEKKTEKHAHALFICKHSMYMLFTDMGVYLVSSTLIFSTPKKRERKQLPDLNEYG